MSNLVIRAFVCVSACAIGLASTIRVGQGQTADSLAREVRELSSEWVELTRIADAVDSLRARDDSIRAMSRAATFISGDLTLVAQYDAIPFVQRHVDDVWAYVSALIGESTSLLSGVPFYVDMPRQQMPQQSRRSQTRRLRKATFGYRIRVGTNRVARLDAVSVPDSRRAIATALNTVVARAANNHLMGAVPEDVRRWAGSIGPISSAPDMRSLYIGLIGLPIKNARACWDRQWDRCRVGLGLIPSEDPLRDWYDDDDRRALVTASYRGQFSTRVEQLARIRCQNGDDPDACYLLLDEWGYTGLPLSPAHRHALVRTALDMGGHAAFARLVNATGTIETKLAATAGTPLDEILEEWRRRIDDAVGTPIRVTGRMSIITLTWMVAFMFAATRSTRWRFD